MSLGKRVIKVTIQPDVTNSALDIVLDDSLDIDVKIHKDVLAYQNKAEIEVIGLTTTLRESLLSRFTAYQLARLNSNLSKQTIFYRVTIDAGYTSDNITQNQALSTVFIGELALVEPSSGPPNVGVRLTCFTHQIDKTLWTTGSLPGSCTFQEMINWVGGQLQAASPTGTFKIVVDTDYSQQVVTNAGQSFRELGAATATLMQYMWPYVYVYIDDDTLFVRDRVKVDNSPVVPINEFVGAAPSWTDNGVKGQTMFNESLRIMSNISVNSKMNPMLANSGFIIGKLDLHLTSRRTPFYTSFEGFITDQSVNQ